MLQERRRALRRQADRELWQRFQALQSQASEEDSREQRHKRRRAIRHTCRVHMALKVGFASHGPLDTWSVSECPIKGRILDLSAEGCSVFSEKIIDVGQELQLIIILRDNNEIRATGMVRWNKSIPQHHGFAAGVQFRNVQDNGQQRILAFLKELDETAGL